MYRIRGSKESKSSHKITPELFVEFFDVSSLDIDLCPASASDGGLWPGDAVDDSKRIPLAAMVYPYGYFVSEALRPFPNADGKVLYAFEFSANLENYERSYVAYRNQHRRFQRRSGRHAASSAAADNNVSFEQTQLTGRHGSLSF